MTIKKENSTYGTNVKRMRDYSNEPAFKKKADDAIAFLKNQEMPKTFKKEK
ncbi:MAG: hypothetical protein ABIN94_08355 [Ferruginibacter sp.]